MPRRGYLRHLIFTSPECLFLVPSWAPIQLKSSSLAPTGVIAHEKRLDLITGEKWHFRIIFPMITITNFHTTITFSYGKTSVGHFSNATYVKLNITKYNKFIIPLYFFVILKFTSDTFWRHKLTKISLFLI